MGDVDDNDVCLHRGGGGVDTFDNMSEALTQISSLGGWKDIAFH